MQANCLLTREAKADARVARRQDARAREDSPEMNKLIGGGDVMGGDDSFAAAKARQAPVAHECGSGLKFAVRAGARSRARTGGTCPAPRCYGPATGL